MPVMWIGCVLPMAMEQDAWKKSCHDRRESTLKHVLCGGNFPLAHPLLARFLLRGGLVWFPTAHVEGAPLSMLLPSSLVSLFRRTAWLLSHCARPTRAFRGRALREHRTLTRQSPSYVSIISKRASNSCPQAVQRMQSDSTVISSDLIPMPPQSGQRASWTL